MVLLCYCPSALANHRDRKDLPWKWATQEDTLFFLRLCRFFPQGSPSFQYFIIETAWNTSFCLEFSIFLIGTLLAAFRPPSPPSARQSGVHVLEFLVRAASSQLMLLGLFWNPRCKIHLYLHILYSSVFVSLHPRIQPNQGPAPFAASIHSLSGRPFCYLSHH